VAKGKHQRKQRWSVALSGILLTVAIVAVVAQFVGSPAARAVDSSGGGGKTVRTVINLPALVLTNLCNGDIVNLSGKLYITTTTRPHRDGGFTVRSTADAQGLRGTRIGPPPRPPIDYRGDDRENTYSYYAPPPQPSTHRVAHWTRLTPLGNDPTARVMILVIVLQETVLDDGTVVPVFDRAYLSCSPRWG
jgi:hypothetical protein